MVGTGRWAGRGTRTWAGMGVGMGAGTGTTIEMKGEGIEKLGTFEVITEVGWKAEDGERRQRGNSNSSHRTRRPYTTVAPCKEPEPRDGRRETGSGRVDVRRKKTQETPGEL